MPRPLQIRGEEPDARRRTWLLQPGSSWRKPSCYCCAVSLRTWESRTNARLPGPGVARCCGREDGLLVPSRIALYSAPRRNAPERHNLIRNVEIGTWRRRRRRSSASSYEVAVTAALTRRRCVDRRKMAPPSRHAPPRRPHHAATPRRPPPRGGGVGGWRGAAGVVANGRQVRPGPPRRRRPPAVAQMTPGTPRRGPRRGVPVGGRDLPDTWRTVHAPRRDLGQACVRGRGQCCAFWRIVHTATLIPL